MADYYTQFSEELRIRSAEEEKWLTDRLQELERLSAGKPDGGGEELQKIYEEVPDDLLYLPDRWTFYGSLEGGDRRLVVSSTEGGFDTIAVVVKHFLARFQPDGFWILRWAETCSKPRISAFGGGALLVTATEIVNHDVEDWIRSLCKSLGEGGAADVNDTD
jgi:hypothetical protein